MLQRTREAPDSGEALFDYLWLLAGASEHRPAALATLVDQWVAARPMEARGHALRGLAILIVEMNETVTFPPTPLPEAQGPWCSAAADLLVDLPLPVEPGARLDTVTVRWISGRVCGWDVDDDFAERDELIRSGAAGPIEQARQGLADGAVDPADLDALTRGLQDEPWRLLELADYVKAGNEGQAAAAARELVLASAREAADAPTLFGAAGVFRLAELRTEEIRARRELQHLDPENARNRQLLALLRHPTEDPSLVDPAERLAAMRRAPRVPPTDFEGLADAALAAGRNGLALRYSWRWWRRSRSTDAALAVAAAAMRTHHHLRRTRAVLDDQLERRNDLGSYSVRFAQDRRERRSEELVRLLDARSKVSAALGHTEAAANDLELALDRMPGPERLVRLGELYLRLGRAGEAVDALAQGAAEGANGRDLLARALAEGQRWAPGDADALIEAHRARLEERPDPVDPFPLEDVLVTGDDGPVRLSSIGGPMLVYVWATWCGACVRSLPQLNDLALEHPTIRFVAVSADSAPERAERWLARYGTAAFLSFHAGPAVLERVGALPASFLLDADHRLVGRPQNLSATDPALLDALARATARSP